VSEASKSPQLKDAYRELAPWKRRLHLVALVLVVIGLGMKGVSAISGGSAGDDGSGALVSGDPKTPLAARKTGTGTGETGNAFLPDAGTKTGVPLPKTGEKLPEPGETGGTGKGGDVAPDGEAFLDEWSPTLVRGGLSFFAAFWIGFALRTFMRICGIFVGLFTLGVLGLQQMGWITVEWAVAQEQFAALPAFLGEQFSGFKTFLQGSLPSAGMAAVGLYAGLQKK